MARISLDQLYVQLYEEEKEDLEEEIEKEIKILNTNIKQINSKLNQLKKYR